MNFVFVDFDLYYTESDSPHGGLIECGGLFEGGGLIESLRYPNLNVSNQGSNQIMCQPQHNLNVLEWHQLQGPLDTMFDGLMKHIQSLYPVTWLRYKLRKNPENKSFIELPETLHNKSSTNVVIVQLTQAVNNGLNDEVEFFREMEAFPPHPEDVYIHSFFVQKNLKVWPNWPTMLPNLATMLANKFRSKNVRGMFVHALWLRTMLPNWATIMTNPHYPILVRHIQIDWNLRAFRDNASHHQLVNESNWGLNRFNAKILYVLMKLEPRITSFLAQYRKLLNSFTLSVSTLS